MRRAGAEPGSRSRPATSGSSPSGWGRRERSGWAKDASVTTRTGTWTTSPVSSRQARSCWPWRRIPQTRTTSGRWTTCGASKRAGGARRGPLRDRDSPLPATGGHEWRTAAGELRELLHRQRRGARADVQRRQRSDRLEHARRTVALTKGRSVFMPSTWSGDSARCTA